MKKVPIRASQSILPREITTGIGDVISSFSGLHDAIGMVFTTATLPHWDLSKAIIVRVNFSQLCDLTLIAYKAAFKTSARYKELKAFIERARGLAKERNHIAHCTWTGSEYDVTSKTCKKIGTHSVVVESHASTEVIRHKFENVTPEYFSSLIGKIQMLKAEISLWTAEGIEAAAKASKSQPMKRRTPSPTTGDR